MMHQGKRLLALLMALVMVISMIPAAAAKGFEKSRNWASNQFSDVPEYQWYYDTVKEAYELGLMSGDPDGSFRPDGSVTLAETVAVASRIHAIHHLGEEKFVQGEVWYEIYVDYALQNGILEAALSEYNRPATRLEFARILSKALPEKALKKINEVEDGAIPDVKDDEAVYLLYRAGVLTGNDDQGTFAPKSNIKRSEVAAIVARMTLPELRKEITLKAGGASIGNVSDFTPSEKVDPEDYIDENNALTQPFDLVYPEVFESGAVEYSGEQILIKLAKDSGLSAALKAAGVTAMEKIMEISSGVWYKAYVDGDVKTVMEAVRQIKDVLVAEYDFAYETEAITDSTEVDSDVHGNKDYVDQWYLCSCGIQKGWGHLKHHHHHGPKPDDTDQGDENVGIAGEGVVVAVIDTGVDYNHEDLKDNIWVNINETPNNGIDDDNNGYVDDYYGVNIVEGQGNGNDDNGHGTHVAGIIAAVDNEMGTVGIAYNAEIMSVKAGQASGFFNQSDIAKAIMYAYEQGADVINMSFGGIASSISVNDALECAYNRCVLVASAGNDGLPNEYVIGWETKPNYPAAHAYVLGVMSVGKDGVESGFTNWDVVGFNSVEYEVYAPGEEMLSTIPNNQYATWSGTSMAAPVVSAMAALVRAEFYDRNTYPTKFIYGQLSGTGTKATCGNLAHGMHSLPNIVDLHAAMTDLPKPKVGLQDYVIFDTPGLKGNEKNNGDGIIDAGETIAIGFTLRNRWGKTEETIVSVDTLSKGGLTDPYVTIVDNDRNYGSIGTYSTKNAGWIEDSDGVYIGWENSIYLQIAENCPNDYTLALNVTLSSTNGLDPADDTIYVSRYASYGDTDGLPVYLHVRRGIVLPNIIETDMTLTADNYYIIPNATLIKKGATVMVEAGTQIQFWTDDPNDSYAQTAITYLTVEGEFICKGTEDAPVRLFPSELMSQYRVEIRGTSGTTELYHTQVVNGHLNLTYAENCEFTQNYRSAMLYYRELSGGVVKDRMDVGHNWIVLAKNCAFRQLGGRYSVDYNFHYSSISSVSGDYEGCIFVDCDLSFGGNYQNCVFLGNNTYLDTKYGDVSTMSIYSVTSSMAEQEMEIFRDPQTGTTYIAMVANYSGGYDSADMEFFAEYLGGHLARIETEREWEYLNSIKLKDTVYAVGMIKDSATGKWLWNDGSEVGAFVPMESSGYGYPLARFDSRNDWIELGLGTEHALIEIPAAYVEEILLSSYAITLDTKSDGYRIGATALPSDVADVLLIYESEDPSIAVVDETGLVKGISEGETVIRVYSPDRAVYNTLRVTVVGEVAMESLDAGENFRMDVGATKQLRPVLTPEETSKQYLTYSSSNEAVATISASGLITAEAVGTAEITVASPETGLSDTVMVEVIVPPDSISIEEQLCVLDLTSMQTTDVFQAVVLPVNTTYPQLDWESSNPEILEVEENGTLIKHRAGVATLRATVTGTDLFAEVTVVLSEQSSDATVVQIERLDQDKYTFALRSDGTLWYWGGAALTPKKLPFEHIYKFDVGKYNGYFWLLLVDDTGTLNVYYSYYNNPEFVFTLNNDPIGGHPIKNIVDVAAYGVHSLGFFLYANEQGAVWGWGANSYGQLGINNTIDQYTTVQMQLPAGVRIENVETMDSNSVLLASNGDLYYSGNSSSDLHVLLPTLYDTGVRSISSINDAVLIEKDDTVQYALLSNSVTTKRGERTYISTRGDFSCWYLENGLVYGYGGNQYGQLGLGDTTRSNSYEVMQKITNAAELFVRDGTVYIQTTDGHFYGVGLNDKHQIPNLSQGNQIVPAKIFFGLEAVTEMPALERTNLTDNVLTERRLVLDFDQSLVLGTGIASVILQNSEGKTMSVMREARLDKFMLEPYGGFVPGETYTLTVPEQALVNRFNVPVAELTLQFTVGELPTEEEKEESSSDTDETPEENQTQINPDAQNRESWTKERVLAMWSKFRLEGPNANFYNNALINRLNREDKVETEWLRLLGKSDASVTGNYWGTTSEFLINKQIVDFDDYQQYSNLNHAGYLTEAPEDVWPFAVKAGLIDKTGTEVEVIGNELMTFYVDFNRDMDTSIKLDVRFGSAYPYADYAVEGQWVNARRWEGTTTLTTLIEGGYQYWSIDNGRAADAPLKLYKDWGRFQFEIDTTSAQAMVLQGQATNTGIELTWTQDDFDTLAGYNVYRADEDEDAYYQRLNETIIPVGSEEFFDDTVEPGKVYYYIFKVVQTDLQESEASGKIMIMSKDTMAPDLYHTPVYHAYAGSNLVISAVATDNLQLQSVQLHYRAAGSEEWKSVEMTSLNDKYSAVIGSNEVTTAGIEYYITAFDGVTITMRGTSMDPYTIVVQEPLGQDALGDVDGDGSISILDALMVLQAKNNRISLEQAEFDRADLDGDGLLTAAEALKILRYANGEIGSLQ